MVSLNATKVSPTSRGDFPLPCRQSPDFPSRHGSGPLQSVGTEARDVGYHPGLGAEAWDVGYHPGIGTEARDVGCHLSIGVEARDIGCHPGTGTEARDVRYHHGGCLHYC